MLENTLISNNISTIPHREIKQSDIQNGVKEFLFKNSRWVKRDVVLNKNGSVVTPLKAKFAYYTEADIRNRVTKSSQDLILVRTRLLTNIFNNIVPKTIKDWTNIENKEDDSSINVFFEKVLKEFQCNLRKQKDNIISKIDTRIAKYVSAQFSATKLEAIDNEDLIITIKSSIKNCGKAEELYFFQKFIIFLSRKMKLSSAQYTKLKKLIEKTVYSKLQNIISGKINPKKSLYPLTEKMQLIYLIEKYFIATIDTKKHQEIMDNSVEFTKKIWDDIDRYLATTLEENKEISDETCNTKDIGNAILFITTALQNEYLYDYIKEEISCYLEDLIDIFLRNLTNNKSHLIQNIEVREISNLVIYNIKLLENSEQIELNKITGLDIEEQLKDLVG